MKSIGSVPAGTLDTIFRSTYTPRTTSYKGQQTKKSSIPIIPLILEKKGSQVWGRIELQGVLVVSCGANRETTAQKLTVQLKEVTNYLLAHDIDRNIRPDDFVFDFHHDLTCVRELFQQFRINHLAEQTNIPQELLSQFMTNKQHPSSQEAQKIETLIQQFGREMINFSLL